MSSEVPPPREPHIPLHAEDLTVSKLQATGVVQVRTVTREHETFFDETLNHERVRIDRIPIGRQVEAMPPVRQEGDTTILSVVEETIVIVRRLILKEENPYPATSCRAAPPGSCRPAEAGSSDHPHRAARLSTSGEIDA